MKKLIIGIVAENNAGKSTVAQVLAQMGGIHYSMRDVIKTEYLRLNSEHVEESRAALSFFSQTQKSTFGPQVFVAKAAKDFISQDHPYAAIESIRAVGEARWLLSLPQFDDFKTLIIGVRAPYQDRLHRFLSGGMGTISGDLTEENFQHHESISKGGTNEWSENVSITMKLAHVVFENPNEKLPKLKNQIENYIKTKFW
jgi:ABC-type dipeptide/oligopeptide/nickel transport system ATPase subunit